MALSAALALLASLPDAVAHLEKRVAALEARLVVAERRPYSVAAASKALGVSEKTIRRKVATGALRYERTGSRIAVYLGEKP